jgi:hypothetical protein
MKLFSLYAFCFITLALLSEVQSVAAVEPYRDFPIVDPVGLAQGVTLNDLIQSFSAEAAHEASAKFGGKPPDETAHHQWCLELLTRAEKIVPQRIWQMDQPQGRMMLPSVLAGNGHGLICGFDTWYAISLLATDSESFKSMSRYAWLWQRFIDTKPQVAFELMATRAHNVEITTIDILRLQGALSYWPGGKLQAPLSKDAWQKLYRATNPVYRLIALEKFDSVEQSPAELLALYRECLFGACSYLEVRALEAITRNKDFREEVAKLLEEYIASNPLANDGTMPGLRNNFPNLIEGAKRVIAAIRNTEEPTAPTLPQVDPFEQSTPTPKPPPVVQPPPPKKTPSTTPTTTTPSVELTSSTPWSVIVILIVPATVLLWLVLKRRS